MCKAYVQSPLALLGLVNGYNRPLDRNDFRRGKVPAWAGKFVPPQGSLRSFMNLSLVPEGAALIDTYGYSSDQKHPLGTIAVSRDGRTFRYTQVGAADLVAGNVIQRAAPIANHLALTAVAEAIGAGTAADPITVTPGATAGAANLYAEGYLQTDTTPGNGYMYRVSGHAAITASVAFNLYLDPDELVQVAFTSSTRYGLHHNLYKNVIQTPTTMTAPVVGVAVSPATAVYFCWLQTRGAAAVLINGTPAVTAPMINGATTAGSADVWTSAAQATACMIGNMMQVGVSGKNNGVMLKVD